MLVDGYVGLPTYKAHISRPNTTNVRTANTVSLTVIASRLLQIAERVKTEMELFPYIYLRMKGQASPRGEL